jgi:hypothetical protein
MVQRSSVGCIVAHRVQRSSVGSALASVRQARVQISAWHPREVCPSEPTSYEENGERPRRMEMDECTV